MVTPLEVGTRFMFHIRGPLATGKWELLVEIVNPDGSIEGTYVCEQPFSSRREVEAAYPHAHKALEEHLARLGVETSRVGLA